MMTQREFQPADESEVARIAEWWITKTDRNYARAMGAGGVDEVIQQVWVALLKNPPPTEWKLTTLVVNTVGWAILELEGRSKKAKFNRGVFLRATELQEENHPVYLMDPAESLEAEELRAKVDEVLRLLPYRSREVLRQRYGLDGQAPLTLEAVGKIWELSRERIRHIEFKALERLQHHSLANQLRPFADFSLEDE